MIFPEIEKVKSPHICQAIRRIDTAGVPQGRESREWELKLAGRGYPPKYVIELAYEYATGGA